MLYSYNKKRIGKCKASSYFGPLKVFVGEGPEFRNVLYILRNEGPLKDFQGEGV